MGKAKNELNWEASRNITDMCRDMWSFQSMNPSGYATEPSISDDQSDTLSVSEEEEEEDQEETKSDSGLSSEGENFDEISTKKTFLHFLQKTNIPGPTHAGTRDL